MFECGDSATSFVKQHVRIFHDDDEFLGSFVELSQAVGPLPKLGAGRELITRYPRKKEGRGRGEKRSEEQGGERRR